MKLKLREEELRTIMFAYQQLIEVDVGASAKADPVVMERMRKLSRKVEKALKKGSICPGCSCLFS